MSSRLVLFGFAFCLAALQVLLAPTVAAAFKGQPLYLILAPPLLAAALASFVTALWSRHLSPRYLTGLTALTLILVFFVQKFLLQHMDSVIVANLQAQAETYGRYQLGLVLAVSIPYFCFASLLTLRLQESVQAPISRWLAIEIAGSALGLGLGCVALAYLGWAAIPTLIVTFCCIVLADLLLGRWKPALAFGLFSLPLVYLSALWLEPKMDLHLAARESDRQKSVRELRRDWTTYAKVQTLEVEGKGALISLNDGDGIARLKKFKPQSQPFTVAAVGSLRPRRALILFAGAGAELVGLHRLLPQAELVGVELNHQVIRHGLADQNLGLAELLRQPQVTLVERDARVYLESGTDTFDVVLYSWSGATVAHISGAIMHTTQYSFTREALAAAWRRVAPNGYLLILGASKINLWLNLHSLGLRHDSAVLLAKPPYDLWDSWDNNMLLIKKGAWTREELAPLSEAVRPEGYQAVITPFAVQPDFQAVADFFAHPQPGLKEGLYFQTSDDNRPYIYSVRPPLEWNSLSFYTDLVAEIWKEGLLADPLNFSALLLLIVVLAWLWPGLSFKAGLVFFVLGLASTIFQLFAIYKYILFLGNPTQSAVLGLGSVLVCSSLAAYFCERFRHWIWLGPCLWMAVSFGLSHFSEWIFAYAPLVRILILSALFIPAMFLSGLAFPLALEKFSKENPNRTPWWVGMDFLSCAIFTALGPVLIESFGMLALVGAAALLLLAILVGLL